MGCKFQIPKSLNVIIKQGNLIFLSCLLDIKCQKCFFCSISQGLGSPPLFFTLGRVGTAICWIFSSPCQWQCELLASVVCRPLTFHILIFSSETPEPNELKLGRKHRRRSSKDCTFCPNPLILVSDWPIFLNLLL